MALLLSVPPAVPAADTDPEEFRVTDVSGEAGFQADGAAAISPVTKDLLIQSGDRLITGKNGRVQLATREGTVLEVQEKSSLEISSFSEKSRVFFLRFGRLLGRLAKRRPEQAAIAFRTPVAVAAVRGTELALEVQESGETSAGVIEGEVAILPADADVAVETGAAPPAPAAAEPETAPLPSKTDAEPAVPAAGDPSAAASPSAGPAEVRVGPSEGVTVRPNERPVKLSALPPVAVSNAAWFPRIRERVPAFREQFRKMDRPAQLRLRREAMRQRIQWTPPARREFQRPSERMKERPRRLERRPARRRPPR